MFVWDRAMRGSRTHLGLALEGQHVLEAGALGDGDGDVRLASALVANVLDEQEDQDETWCKGEASRKLLATGGARTTIVGHVD